MALRSLAPTPKPPKKLRDDIRLSFRTLWVCLRKGWRNLNLSTGYDTQGAFKIQVQTAFRSLAARTPLSHGNPFGMSQAGLVLSPISKTYAGAFMTDF